jgi:ribonuclease HIII
MTMTDLVFQAAVHAFREHARAQGWEIADERAIPHGYQFRVRDGSSEVPVNLYATGRAVIQGKPSSLQTAIQAWWAEQAAAASRPAAKANGFVDPAPTGLSRIGLDESGKGDYFGPLVIGAAHVDAATEGRLLALGVRDSKRLTDERIGELADRIQALCICGVVAIEPPSYNRLHAQFKNLNRLLAWGHARALENVLGRVACDLAIADQFGDAAYLREALLEKGRGIRLEQRPHAEDDVAVAAASILARAAFVRRLQKLSGQVGIALPKGASDPAILAAGRAVLARGGRDALAQVAKLHFKTTRLIESG